MSKQVNNYERLMNVIQAPYISEKGTFIGEAHNQTIFRVLKNATKKEIKAAVELLWKDQKIEVKKVQTINVKGKQKRFGRLMGRRNNWKKAIVSIKEGQELTFTNLTKAEGK
ncbi:large subunit ribosomal protein L23 [Nitrosomonas sp. Nm51]|uniref:50S ribosomal protein L23 n=1 Tax=Nitrosomonas sp. Nm51 TaxID=133720 RepID=UPI0008C70CFA|nr:50S ribosomal protein L23 [Nitrosomonas sp. Nm51]SER60257.1 large subunit ribosomal protein L23 [Nitrosomonas sp. Nm51]